MEDAISPEKEEEKVETVEPVAAEVEPKVEEKAELEVAAADEKPV